VKVDDEGRTDRMDRAMIDSEKTQTIAARQMRVPFADYHKFDFILSLLLLASAPLLDLECPISSVVMLAGWQNL